MDQFFLVSVSLVTQSVTANVYARIVTGNEYVTDVLRMCNECATNVVGH